MISATIIADSVSPSGERLTTVEAEFHRFILPELNTHRVFSRNYQSSRAVPVQKMIEQVRNNPAMPVHWGKNKPGMTADEENDSPITLYGYSPIEDDWISIETTPQEGWETASSNAAEIAQAYFDAGYHKQIVNRLLEPFMWTKGIITASGHGWESFFKLRCHPAAQPEIQALAYKIKDAMEASTPIELNYGDWHLPYVEWNKDVDGQYFTDEEVTSLDEAIKVSTSCCAQVSYRNLDQSLEKAKKIYNMLSLPSEGEYPEDPPHFSPAEHVAKCVESSFITMSQSSEETLYFDGGGNFNTTEFLQYRKALEIGKEKEIINDKET